MYCEHCGTEKGDDVKFCGVCGEKSKDDFSVINSSTIVSDAVENQDVFYSKEWQRKKVFALASLPYFDLMVDTKFLYIIRLPRYSGGTWGLILGFGLLSIIGAAIGQALGSSNDSKKRKWYRSAWIDSENKLTSHAYNQDVFLKVPLENLRSYITMGKNRFTLTYNNENIVLKASNEEFTRFNNHIKKYVL